ncbi:hypothetical protein SAMN05421505_109125 [Sinosporangium album]|uniref:Uncharacterized protein n=1 Tax=Sinosporangium album TaxID=504805 RepID=A0A1G7Y6Z6_9ACTN|nr:hypothetical protein SAMN05421505_109125 [Sinosporangium album]
MRAAGRRVRHQQVGPRRASGGWAAHAPDGPLGPGARRTSGRLRLTRPTLGPGGRRWRSGGRRRRGLRGRRRRGLRGWAFPRRGFPRRDPPLGGLARRVRLARRSRGHQLVRAACDPSRLPRLGLGLLVPVSFLHRFGRSAGVGPCGVRRIVRPASWAWRLRQGVLQWGRTVLGERCGERGHPPRGGERDASGASARRRSWGRVLERRRLLRSPFRGVRRLRSSFRRGCARAR